MLPFRPFVAHSSHTGFGEPLALTLPPFSCHHRTFAFHTPLPHTCQPHAQHSCSVSTCTEPGYCRPPSSPPPYPAVTSLPGDSFTLVSGPTCPSFCGHIPSGAPQSHPHDPASFLLHSHPSQPHMSSILFFRTTMLALRPLPAGSESQVTARCLLGYIHLLAVCLVQGPSPVSDSLDSDASIYPDSGSSAHLHLPARLCPLPSAPSTQ